MTETGWQAIGRIARLRRERLGLKQEDLAQYGGPGVSTVGKFERAAQERFPLRTQHQIENALGWDRSTIEQFVKGFEENPTNLHMFEHDLIEDDIPDLSRPRTNTTDPELGAQLEALGRILALVPPEARDEALRNAVTAVLPLISGVGATGAHRAPDLTFTGADGTVTEMDVKVYPQAARTGQSRGRELRRRQDEEAEASQDVETSYGSQIIDPHEQPQPAGGRRPSGDATE